MLYEITTNWFYLLTLLSSTHYFSSTTLKPHRQTKTKVKQGNQKIFLNLINSKYKVLDWREGKTTKFYGWTSQIAYRILRTLFSEFHVHHTIQGIQHWNDGINISSFNPRKKKTFSCNNSIHLISALFLFFAYSIVCRINIIHYI